MFNDNFKNILYILLAAIIVCFAYNFFSDRKIACDKKNYEEDYEKSYKISAPVFSTPPPITPTTSIIHDGYYIIRNTKLKNSYAFKYYWNNNNIIDKNKNDSINLVKNISVFNIICNNDAIINQYGLNSYKIRNDKGQYLYLPDKSDGSRVCWADITSDIENIKFYLIKNTPISISIIIISKLSNMGIGTWGTSTYYDGERDPNTGLLINHSGNNVLVDSWKYCKTNNENMQYDFIPYTPELIGLNSYLISTEKSNNTFLTTNLYLSSTKKPSAFILFKNIDYTWSFVNGNNNIVAWSSNLEGSEILDRTTSTNVFTRFYIVKNMGYYRIISVENPDLVWTSSSGITRLYKTTFNLNNQWENKYTFTRLTNDLKTGGRYLFCSANFENVGRYITNKFYIESQTNPSIYKLIKNDDETFSITDLNGVPNLYTVSGTIGGWESILDRSQGTFTNNKFYIIKKNNFYVILSSQDTSAYFATNRTTGRTILYANTTDGNYDVNYVFKSLDINLSSGNLFINTKYFQNFTYDNVRFLNPTNNYPLVTSGPNTYGFNMNQLSDGTWVFGLDSSSSSLFSQKQVVEGNEIVGGKLAGYDNNKFYILRNPEGYYTIMSVDNTSYIWTSTIFSTGWGTRLYKPTLDLTNNSCDNKYLFTNSVTKLNCTNLNNYISLLITTMLYAKSPETGKYNLDIAKNKLLFSASSSTIKIKTYGVIAAYEAAKKGVTAGYEVTKDGVITAYEVTKDGLKTALDETSKFFTDLGDEIGSWFGFALKPNSLMQQNSLQRQHLAIQGDYIVFGQCTVKAYGFDIALLKNIINLTKFDITRQNAYINIKIKIPDITIPVKVTIFDSSEINLPIIISLLDIEINIDTSRSTKLNINMVPVINWGPILNSINIKSHIKNVDLGVCSLYDVVGSVDFIIATITDNIISPITSFLSNTLNNTFNDLFMEEIYKFLLDATKMDIPKMLDYITGIGGLGLPTMIPVVKNTFNESINNNEMKLNVFSYNVYSFPYLQAYTGQNERIPLIVQRIVDYDKIKNLDVVAISEIWSGPGVLEKLSPFKKAFIQEMQKNWPYFIILDTVDKIYDGGCVLFSKWPILQSDTIIFQNYFGEDGLTSKGAIWIQIKKTIGSVSKIFNIASCHLQSGMYRSPNNLNPERPESTNGLPYREAQLEEMKLFIESKKLDRKDPFIYAGDLNSDHFYMADGQQYFEDGEDEYSRMMNKLDVSELNIVDDAGNIYLGPMSDRFTVGPGGINSDPQDKKLAVWYPKDSKYYTDQNRCYDGKTGSNTKFQKGYPWTACHSINSDYANVGINDDKKHKTEYIDYILYSNNHQLPISGTIFTPDIMTLSTPIEIPLWSVKAILKPPSFIEKFDTFPPNRPLIVGDLVECNFSTPSWYRGKIMSVNNDGTYKIQVGFSNYNLPRDSIRYYPILRVRKIDSLSDHFPVFAQMTFSL